jgi:hypothetical protein
VALDHHASLRLSRQLLSNWPLGNALGLRDNLWFARQPGAIAIVFDSRQRRKLFRTTSRWLRTTEWVAFTELTISHEFYFLER